MGKMDERMEMLRDEFKARYGDGDLRFFRAPGRVNLLGEHTDYNDGWVLPIAINRDISIASRARDDRVVRLYSLDFQEETEFSLDDIAPSTTRKWSNYVRGIALELEKRKIRLKGMDAVLQGNVPIASGLSSSAAMEIGFALAFQGLNGFDMAPVEMALLAQKTEHEFIGVMSGIMDQFISRMGQKDHALLIDCRSLESRAIPLSGALGAGRGSNRDLVFVVGDTRVRRALADSEYNIRRRQCEEAVRLLEPALPGIKALRDVSLEQLQAHEQLLPEEVRKRARHVVTEDERVLQGVAALEGGDMAAFGRCMNGSHDSLRDDYEVSSAELDTIVKAARSVPGVLGSRMTGAGFGGCTVSLVEKTAVEKLTQVVKGRYQAAFHKEPSLYVCTAENGAHEVK
ncbi:MAG TPA: galactokinase [Armatimonadota bacterium]|nr:galactokinase [Armatimonadota bacterium]